MAIDEKDALASVTAGLRVHGWQHLDAILLAALATHAPTLLIGLHGTAKTRLVEQVAAALHLTYRHYNASLLNYDDLIGIPMPDETGEALRFITNKGAIWQAEFVFFDEISRCRPDLQNKLFPIIHERRVVGQDLPLLRHRWAAMNPPASVMNETDTGAYLGSEALDTALVDRFWFIIPVPAWHDLSRKERLQVILGDDEADDAALPDFDLMGLIARCQTLLPGVAEVVRAWLGDYLVCAIDLLDKARLPQSPRRARQLAKNIIAVHAARMVLEGEQVDLETSAELALAYSIPQNATETPPTLTTLTAIHRQAWEITNHLDDSVWRQILEESDVVKRVLLADELDVSDEDMARLITGVLAADLPLSRKVGLAVAMFMAFQTRRNLPALAWEPLVKLARPVLTPGYVTYSALPQNEVALWTNEIRPWSYNQRDQEMDIINTLKVNYVLSGMPTLWRQHKWQDALGQFHNDLHAFHLMETSS